jgi:hypothetical protein
MAFKKIQIDWEELWNKERALLKKCVGVTQGVDCEWTDWEKTVLKGLKKEFTKK